MTEKPSLAELSVRLARFRSRDAEIREAARASPGMEIGAAYKKWLAARDRSPDQMLSDEFNTLKKEVEDLTRLLRERPCTKAGCAGTQYLEGVCAGCIEGQAGYKTKWTCRTCLHRDLSKEDLNQWLTRLSSG